MGYIDLASGDGDLILHGSVNPNGRSTTCFFEYGPDDPEHRPGPYSHLVPCKEDPGAGTSEVQVSATVAAAEVPDGEASHFRLVAISAGGRAEGEDQPIGSVVCFCGGWPPPVASQASVGAKAAIVNGRVRVRVGCKGGETWCVGGVRLIARKKRARHGAVETVQLAEGSYEVGPGKRRIVSIPYPSASRHLLKKPESLVRFALDGPDLERRVVEFTTVDF